MIKNEQRAGCRKVNVIFLLILPERKVQLSRLSLKNTAGCGRSGINQCQMTEEKLKAYRKLKKQFLLKSLKKVKYKMLSRQETAFLLSIRNGNVHPTGN